MQKTSKNWWLVWVTAAVVVLVLCGAQTRAAAFDLTGTWKCEVTFDDGRKGTPTFTFKQEGEKLSGNYKGGLGEAPVTGIVKGDEVTFAFKAKVTGMGDEQEITVTFNGKIAADGSLQGSVKATALMPPGKWLARKQ